MKKLTSILAVVIALQGIASGGITVYENKYADWTANLPGAVNTINWDDVKLPSGQKSTKIPGDHYTSMFGSPNLSVANGPYADGLWVGDPTLGFYQNDFHPVSKSNVFAVEDYKPGGAGPQGILTITFNQPMYALGAWFLDVEGDYLGTGIKVGGTLYDFTRNQGDDSISFLGIISTTGFTTADIYMSAINSTNGVGLDDVMYAVPLPASILLGVFAVGLAGRKLRKFV